MTSKKGRRYELNTCKDLNGLHKEITAYPAGYSGNQYGPSPDIILTTPSGAHALELKKTGLKKRRTVVRGDEFEMLEECKNSYTKTWIVIAVSHRKTLVVPADGDVEAAIPDAFEPSVTDKGNLRISKPDTSDWDSKQKQKESDAELILNTIANHG